ncbi:MAG TPA: SDR family oxidoreductase [Steroidobacteraceae bacterium]|nr:SDR family oxidoreductase [Steroidobacteraceae bacterium]
MNRTALSAARLPLDFHGRKCIVTGAARGIGRAIALALAAHGATVVIADRSMAESEATCAVIARAGGAARAIAVDLAERAEIVRLMSQATGYLGGLDILVHNAAHLPVRPLADIDTALLERTLAVNLEAAFWLTQTALPMLRHSGRGRILITSSVTGPRVAYPGLAHYAASKAGLNGFIRSAALELAGEGITVNGVEPGMIATPAAANLGDDDHQEWLARRIPLGRLGKPEDIAFAMLFLASDGAAYITGQTLIVDGGALLPECGWLGTSREAPPAPV